MGKIIRFVLVALLTAMSLTTRAQEKDTLKVQSDSVSRNVSYRMNLKESQIYLSLSTHITTPPIRLITLRMKG